MRAVLAIGGFDPSGGAGILADARAIRAAGAWPYALITTLTAQSTRGLIASHPVSAASFREALAAVCDDVRPRAIKIGALGSDAIAGVVASFLETQRAPLVLDPVLAPTRGTAALGSVAGVRALAARATLFTPNVPEATALLGAPIRSETDARVAAERLKELGATAVLLKGGHLRGRVVVDWLVTDAGVVRLARRRVAGGERRGTGCTLASLAAGRLALRASRAKVSAREIEAVVRWAIERLVARMRASVRVGRGLPVLLGSVLAFVAGTAQAQPAEPAESCPLACRTPRAALEDVAARLSAALSGTGAGKLPNGVRVASAPLESDAEVRRGTELVATLVQQIAGHIGPGAHAHLEAVTLADARPLAVDDRVLVHLVPRIAGGRLSVSADAFPVPQSVWARARAPQPLPRAHAHATVALDAELRSYLAPIPLAEPQVARFAGADADVEALACGDLDGDGAPELATVTRQRVLLVRLAGAQVVRLREARWEELAPIAPAPLRQPLGFATVIEGDGTALHPNVLDVGLSDRSESVRLDAQLQPVARFAGLAMPVAGATGCGRTADLLLQPELSACLPSDAPPPLALGRAGDAVAGAVLARPGQAPKPVVLVRSDGTITLRAANERDVVLGRGGAQLALADLDQDGALEVASSIDTLDPKHDALLVRTLLASGTVERRYQIQVPTGIEALAACPPDGPGRAPLVLASRGEIWLVR